MKQPIICDICGKSDFKTTQALHGHKSIAHANVVDRSWKVSVGSSTFSGYEVLALISILEYTVKKCNPKKEVDKISFLKDMIIKLQEVTLGQKPIDFTVNF